MENRPLEDLPILTKSTLMENFDELVTDRSIRLADVDAHLKHDDGDRMFQGRYVALSTSGSTGLRGAFCSTHENGSSALPRLPVP